MLTLKISILMFIKKKISKYSHLTQHVHIIQLPGQRSPRLCSYNSTPLAFVHITDSPQSFKGVFSWQTLLSSYCVSVCVCVCGCMCLCVCLYVCVYAMCVCAVCVCNAIQSTWHIYTRNRSSQRRHRRRGPSRTSFSDLLRETPDLRVHTGIRFTYTFHRLQ